MSVFMTWLTIVLLLALAALFLYHAIKKKVWRPLIVQIIALVALFLFLHANFDFPTLAQTPVSKGGGRQDIYFVIVLNIFMLLGMLAQYGFMRFEQPQKERKEFDIGLFLAPVFASPIIFIPLLAALQSADMDLARLDAPRLMMFLVAFENGFFWKEYFDHRRKNIKDRGDEK